MTNYKSKIKNIDAKIKSLETDEIPTESYSDSVNDRVDSAKIKLKETSINILKNWFYLIFKK